MSDAIVVKWFRVQGDPEKFEELTKNQDPSMVQVIRIPLSKPDEAAARFQLESNYTKMKYREPIKGE